MTYCSVVTVLALLGLTKKRFGHYAILKNLSLRSPRYFKKVRLYVSTYRKLEYSEKLPSKYSFRHFTMHQLKVENVIFISVILEAGTNSKAFQIGQAEARFFFRLFLIIFNK